jgi:TolB-like protein
MDKNFMIRSSYFKYIVLLVLCAAVTLPAALLAAETRPYRVAVVPFTVNAEKDLTYLKNGIADMMTSRLAWENKVQVLGREQTVSAAKQATGPLNEIQAQILGAKLQADYVLFGSLTIFGNSVSMDAKMMDVSGERQTLSFFNQAEGMEQVIPQINRFATEINAKVFGRQVARPVTLAPTAAAPATGGGATGAPAQGIDVHAHPEKLMESDFSAENTPPAAGGAPFAAAQPQQQQNSLNPAFIAQAGANRAAGNFWKGPIFKHLLDGIEIGDVNKDGLNELVTVTPKWLYIHQVSQGRFRKVFEYQRDSFALNLSVDLADINGNGIPEIFITGLTSQRTALNSIVLEFNGQTYAVIADKQPYFFRAINHPTRGRVLVGQRQILESATPFDTAISELAWVGGELNALDRVVKPKTANALGTGWGDIQNDGGETVAAYNKFAKLQLLRVSGESLWQGQEQYGGNLQHVLGEKNDQDMPPLPFYLPSRLRVADLDRNGQYEVILFKNKESLGGKLETYRSYGSGHMEALIWDGMGLASIWKTRKISGRIQDFAIGDLNNDGKTELVVAVIVKEGRVVATKPQSTIIAYELSPKK